jgi:hypothetical protein
VSEEPDASYRSGAGSAVLGQASGARTTWAPPARNTLSRRARSPTTRDRFLNETGASGYRSQRVGWSPGYVLEHAAELGGAAVEGKYTDGGRWRSDAQTVEASVDRGVLTHPIRAGPRRTAPGWCRRPVLAALIDN